MNNSHLHFFNHLRYLMILFAVLFHASISYSNLVPWWFVHDKATASVFNLLILFFDVFMMPVLFFIAGFFALPSIERKGVSIFIKEKFTGHSTIMVLAYSFIRSFLCLSIMVVLIAFSSRFWNRSSTIDTILSENSYNIYLFHLPIVVSFQFIMTDWQPDPAGAARMKFFMVATLAITLSCALSALLKRLKVWRPRNYLSYQR